MDIGFAQGREQADKGGKMGEVLDGFLNIITWRRKLRIVCNTTGERFVVTNNESYHQYTGSRHFYEIKKRCHEMQKGRCASCRCDLSGRNKVGHHTSTNAYRRLGHEIAGSDVIVVCTDCHDGRSETHKRLHRFKIPEWAKNHRKGLGYSLRNIFRI